MTPSIHLRLVTTLRHRWLDAGDSRRALSPAAIEHLRERVAASERGNTGQIRICVESSLPTSYLWRHVRHRTPMNELVHQRALMMFSKLRVWDTAHNNGVLIYLLLAEHAIDLIADRGLTCKVDSPAWRIMIDHLGDALRRGLFEQGLVDAVEDVSAVLAEHFPKTDETSDDTRNELPDAPVVC